MANHYLTFSEAIVRLTLPERDWLRRQLQIVYVFGGREYTEDDLPEGLSPEAADWRGSRVFRDLPDDETEDGFQYDFEEDDDDLGRYLWLYADEGGSPDLLAHLVQEFLRQFRPHECWSMTYATTCSKLRLGEFSGGARFVTAERIESFDAHDFVSEKRAAFDQRSNGASRSLGDSVESNQSAEPADDNGPCECELPGIFCSGVPGILAAMENGRLAPGATVERCDACQRYPSDEAAREKLKELGLA